MVYSIARVRNAADACFRSRPAGLCSLSRPMYINVGMLSKTGPGPEQGTKPEGTGN